MDKISLTPSFAEGEYSTEQLRNLEHLNEFCPGWWGWEKGQKRPMGKNGPGRVNDGATELKQEQALAIMEQRQWGGVGVSMRTAVPGLVGMDLDHVIDGGSLSDLGHEAVKRFAGAYVEVSPSGTGLRIFAIGDKPKGSPEGSTAVGDGQKVELYQSTNAGRFLRVTGDVVEGTAGEVAPSQAGIDWLAGIATAAMAGNGHGSPDNAIATAKKEALSIDAVFDQLAKLRPEREAGEVLSGMRADAANQPRGTVAQLLKGNLSKWNGDWSEADFYACCVALKRGAGSLDHVVEVWHSTPLGKRPKDRKPEKNKRAGYLRETVEGAARSVLEDLRKKAASGARAAVPASPLALPEGLSEALALSGDKMTFTRGRQIAPSEGNVVILFRNAPELQGMLGFNELSQRAQRLKGWRVFDRHAASESGQMTEDDLTRVGMYLEREYGMKVERNELMRGLEAASLDAAFDPLSDRLTAMGKEWDGVERLNTWLTEWAQIDDTGCEAYVSAVGIRFMVGAVARALKPGCQMDNVLAVEGSGGGGKSTMFQVLADAVAPDLFTAGVHDVSNPKALVEATGGRWLVELAELAGVRRAGDVEALKAALTRRKDTDRRPYDKLPREIARRFVFVATTNRSEYLSDPSGALLRRFWPVRTLATEQAPIDRKGLAAIAPQLWAEAVARYWRGDPWHLSPEDGDAYTQWTSGRELRREDGAFHDELVGCLSRWLPDYFAKTDKAARPIADIAREVGDMRTVEGDQASRNRLADTLRSFGMQSTKRGGVKRWNFTPEGARLALIRAEEERRPMSAVA